MFMANIYMNRCMVTGRILFMDLIFKVLCSGYTPEDTSTQTLTTKEFICLFGIKEKMERERKVNKRTLLIEWSIKFKVSRHWQSSLEHKMSHNHNFNLPDHSCRGNVYDWH